MLTQSDTVHKIWRNRARQNQFDRYNAAYVSSPDYCRPTPTTYFVHMTSDCIGLFRLQSATRSFSKVIVSAWSARLVHDSRFCGSHLARFSVLSLAAAVENGCLQWFDGGLYARRHAWKKLLRLDMNRLTMLSNIKHHTKILKMMLIGPKLLPTCHEK